MTFQPEAIQRLHSEDVPEWLQVGDRPAYVGYLADEAEGSHLGLAYIRFRAGVQFDFLWAYDEVAVVTRGSLTVQVGGETIAINQVFFLPGLLSA
jgi:ethanolamine utilization protein EutQ (cupin superfamily)